jgi:hypothetical protein
MAMARVALRDAPDPSTPVLLDRTRHAAQWRAASDAFTTLTDRGTRLLFVMTGHNSRVYTYDAQMREGFPRIEGLDRILTCVRHPDSGHTFTRESHREQLERAMLGWLEAGAGR